MGGEGKGRVGGGVGRGRVRGGMRQGRAGGRGTWHDEHHKE